MPDLSKYGPWALIVGGSEGAGAAFARKLAADGFKLVRRRRGELGARATALSRGRSGSRFAQHRHTAKRKRQPLTRITVLLYRPTDSG